MLGEGVTKDEWFKAVALSSARIPTEQTIAVSKVTAIAINRGDESIRTMHFLPGTKTFVAMLAVK